MHSIFNLYLKVTLRKHEFFVCVNYACFHVQLILKLHFKRLSIFLLFVVSIYIIYMYHTLEILVVRTNMVKAFFLWFLEFPQKCI